MKRTFFTELLPAIGRSNDTGGPVHGGGNINATNVLPSLLEVINKGIHGKLNITLNLFSSVSSLAHRPSKTKNLLELDTNSTMHLIYFSSKVILRIERLRLTIYLSERRSHNFIDITDLRFGTQKDVILFSPTFDQFSIFIEHGTKSIKVDKLHISSSATGSISSIGHNQYLNTLSRLHGENKRYIKTRIFLRVIVFETNIKGNGFSELTGLDFSFIQSLLDLFMENFGVEM